jgi:hypothetical protein
MPRAALQSAGYPGIRFEAVPPLPTCPMQWGEPILREVILWETIAS